MKNKIIFNIYNDQESDFFFVMKICIYELRLPKEINSCQRA